jgi:hypothetical protein
MRTDSTATYSDEAYSDRVYADGIYSDVDYREVDYPAPDAAHHQTAYPAGTPMPVETPSWDRATEGHDVMADSGRPGDPDSMIIGNADEGRQWKPIIALVAAVAFLIGSGVVLARLVSAPDDDVTAAPPPAATATAEAVPPAATDPSPPVSIEPAPANPATATFELASDTTEIRVSLTRLDEGLFRLTTPSDSGVVPQARLTGTTLRLSVTPNGDKGSGRVDMVLDDRTTWSFRMTGGVKRAVFDLSRAAVVPRIDLVGGAARIDMTLPTLRAVVPIRMSGGVHDWTIRTAQEVPIKVQLRQGAGEVTLNGERQKGIAQGQTLTAPATEAEPGAGLNLDAVAGVGTLTVSAEA